MTDSVSATPLRVAIVGAGPSGFYAAGQLLGDGFEVDLYDALPTPFGLVRAGVAPDHPNIKAVTRVFEKTAKKDGFRFYGGITLGQDIRPADLESRYHAVVYSFGTSTDNRLGIPGEDLPGSHPATEFVAWYNGHPTYADHDYDLSSERVIVVGNGNVAIDVARMIVLAEEELTPTDTADHAIHKFTGGGTQEVMLLGRRGPAQAAFTNPELLELGELARADVIVDPAYLELDEASEAWLESEDAHTTNRKNVEIMRGYAAREPAGKERRVVLEFLWSPVEIIGTDRVEGLRVVRNRIEAGENGALKAVSTGEEKVIPCGMVVRSIGYRGIPMEGIPFDERRGLIRNEGGRVVEDGGSVRTGAYAVGWIKRGPSGVIGTNKKDAADTVARIREDAEAGLLNADRPSADEVEAFLTDTVGRYCDWQGWKAIDAHETAAGAEQGRPRVKLVRVDHMHDVAGKAPTG
ncbi:FAD-dependent oxidoreductase [Paraconexibacter antarcticus]|uniref:ferredoxin--NADP(+) reductase n=1 Tax=Paraconexibacter antarcticus TaxID=2949664 RepID=A0ABY5DT99_9ACTN|nr:FAD-dependent oxidoreductase [Paraconexibacter antarcticus]UTI64901.1 FAD-dependent oxidoreductase [Paraconexibacter antarcticus]